MEKLTDLNIAKIEILPTPEYIFSKYPLTEAAAKTVADTRKTLADIFEGNDKRLFVVVGPCSIHDINSAKEYAHKLKALADKVKDTMVLIMRTYFEKPRSSVGWKGFLNDPFLNGTYRIEAGLEIGRKLLLDINEIGVPVATEVLDRVTPQYLDDLFSWVAIGARTTESQTHREMASGISAPVGFKNTTDGGISAVIGALKSVASPHHFIGINRIGQACIFATRGNKYSHIVLRGGKGPNYDAENIAKTEETLKQNKVSEHIMVDCSHGNSNKDPENQPAVFANCIEQIRNGNKSIRSFMIESNLDFGSQAIPEDLSELKYGVSITDGCIDWNTTEKAILDAHEVLKTVL